MKKILVFPGQGSQTVGMGKEIYENFQEARNVFEEVQDVLKTNLINTIFSGPAEDLNLTENTQPALMTISAAFLRVMEKEFGFDVSESTFVAGHSLGEYTALLAAGVITLEQAARLLKIRGREMQKAVPVGRGKMIAVLGLTLEQAESVVAVVRHELPQKVCALANDNCLGQYVLSGHADAIDLAMQIAKEKGAKRCLPLPVSAPFHSPLMEPAAIEMQSAIYEESFLAAKVPLICNITAEKEDQPEALKENLVKQICGRVRWTETIQYAEKQGCQEVLEIGAGKVLSGLTRRISPALESQSISDLTSLKAYVSSEA